ncbi:glycosyltransferase [Marinobacter sp. F4216]|uniref:glycosyltransferase n=1 Tax=Marinobacter sp. F4216 TaxID=2874281 RepID=UPI001CBFE9DB|nr:glycosyltransferase [Marinobacter sp. F4216]MBZ2168427.1 glycosyltransferase [Marinobacter sp. F4216]
MVKVLHVTESMGAGVTTAINSYVKSSSCFEHYLFASVRTSDITGEEEDANFKASCFVSRSISAIKNFKRFVVEINPDVLHVHSTFAGFFVRIFCWKLGVPVIYTPHGFSFLRDDKFGLSYLYLFLERVLSHRTHVLAGCSKDEASIAASLSRKWDVFELVNICEPIDIQSKPAQRKGRLQVGMVGRITNQKGYRFFGEISKRLADEADFVWLGGGAPVGEKFLRKCGVKVTGWTPRSEVLKALSKLDVYFHSAEWDGFPVSVLEAVEVSRPLVLRNIGPFSSEGLNTVTNVDDAYEEFRCLIRGEESAWARADANLSSIRERHTSARLSRELVRLYSRFG